MAQPDWVAIFTLRPDLEPPGYAEKVIDVIDRPKAAPAKRRNNSSNRPSRYPSLKHGAD